MLALIDGGQALESKVRDYVRGKLVSERLLPEVARRQGRGDISIRRELHIWARHPSATDG